MTVKETDGRAVSQQVLEGDKGKRAAHWGFSERCRSIVLLRQRLGGENAQEAGEVQG